MTYAENRQARHEYEILETFEAGLSLLGPEVRSVRNGGANLQGSFVRFENGRLVLKNTFISPYAPAGLHNAPDPRHDRALLLTKRELHRLRGRLEADRLTLIPLNLHTKGRLLKLELGLCRGKKSHDKRATIKARDLARSLARGLE
jgi:SsrA-binding protein